MKTFDFVHLAIHALDGEIRGKTNLQKKIYFLAVLSSDLDELGYGPHYYGPYSDDVALAVEELKTAGFVEQNVIGGFATDESGFERRRYDYRLTDAGRRVAQSKAREHSELWDRMTKAAERLKQAGDPDYMRLSVAAKTYFLLGEHRMRATESELARLGSRFGWRVTPDEITEAARFLQKLGLVEID